MQHPGNDSEAQFPRNQSFSRDDSKNSKNGLICPNPGNDSEAQFPRNQSFSFMIWCLMPYPGRKPRLCTPFPGNHGLPHCHFLMFCISCSRGCVSVQHLTCDSSVLKRSFHSLEIYISPTSCCCSTLSRCFDGVRSLCAILSVRL